jgi:hypothetical protein
MKFIFFLSSFLFFSSISFAQSLAAEKAIQDAQQKIVNAQEKNKESINQRLKSDGYIILCDSKTSTIKYIFLKGYVFYTFPSWGPEAYQDFRKSYVTDQNIRYVKNGNILKWNDGDGARARSHEYYLDTGKYFTKVTSGIIESKCQTLENRRENL